MSNQPRIRITSDGLGAGTKVETAKVDKNGRVSWHEVKMVRSADLHLEAGKVNTATMEVLVVSVEAEAQLTDLKLIDPRPKDRSGTYVSFHTPFRTNFGRGRQVLTVEKIQEAGVDQALLVEELCRREVDDTGFVGDFKLVEEK